MSKRTEREFRRELTPSRDLEGLWHFLPCYDSGTSTPLPTPDGKSDRQNFSWKEIFSVEQSIELEIGSGKGNFLTEYAKLHRDRNILGSDWEPKIAHYAARRLKRNKLENAAMLRGDVYYFLRDRIPADSISAFHMYFPDPWPKKRHHKKRLLQPKLLEELRRTAKGGKVLFHWATDHAEYNVWAREFFDECPYLKLVADPAEAVDGILTNFEKKYIVESRPIYRRCYQILKG